MWEAIGTNMIYTRPFCPIVFAVRMNAAVDFTTYRCQSVSAIFGWNFNAVTYCDFCEYQVLFRLYSFTGAPLSINHSFCWFCTFSRFEIYLRPIFLWSDRSSHQGNHCIHLVLVYFDPFSRLRCIFCTFATNVYIWPTIMYFWSWWIPMVRPCRFSTLHKEIYEVVSDT